MNSTNWPLPKEWIFIVQLVEHCSTYAETIGSNFFEGPRFFFFFFGGGGGGG